MPEDPTPILELEHVNVRFGEKWGLRDVSLTVSAAETVIVLGAAGSGKTTLLKAIIGLAPVNSGAVRLFGEDITHKSERELFPIRSKVGFLFQEGGLFDSLLVGENVAYPFQNQSHGADLPDEAKIERRVCEALTFVELGQTINQYPSELSGGMRRRVGIARAVVTNPPLVLYDSPTAGLDPITANTIMAVVAKQRDVQKTASLIVTHRYQDGELMAKFEYDPARKELVPLTSENGDGARATRFIVMKDGEIVFQGAIDDLEASQDGYVKRFVRHEG